MTDIVALFEQHGIASVFLGVLVEQLGAPVPAVPFLLLAGARSASDGLFALKALSAAAMACVIADSLWFMAGRRYGRSVLGLLCRVSLSPDTCVRQSELSFERRGILTVLFAKFIPGVSTLTSPMAGALRMPLLTFVLVDAAGTILWAGTGIAAGLVFHSQVQRLIARLSEFGGTAALALAGLLAMYVAWRALRRYLVYRRLRQRPRVSPHGLVGMMEHRQPVVLLDVRSGPLLPDARIPGAIRAPLDGAVIERAEGIPAEAVVVTYCDCPNDASACRAADKLAKLGYETHVLGGGLSAWTAAGLPVEAGSRRATI